MLFARVDCASARERKSRLEIVAMLRTHEQLTPEESARARQYQENFDLEYVTAMIEQRLNSLQGLRIDCVEDFAAIIRQIQL